jgi:hypothetical protein
MEGGARKNPELSEANRTGNVKLIEAVKKAYKGKKGIRPVDEESFEKVVELTQNVVKDEQDFTQNAGITYPVRGLQRGVFTGDYRLALIRRGEQYWIINITTGSTLGGPYPTLNMAEKALNRIIAAIEGGEVDELD